MHPSGPAKSFIWPVRTDVCWVPSSDILSITAAPTTVTGRTYDIAEKEMKAVNAIFFRDSK